MAKSETWEVLQEIIDYFEDPVCYDPEEVRSDMIAEIEGLKGNAPDEIGLERDGECLMILDDFTREFYNKVISGLCNVLKSYQEEVE